ncbi:enoyl-CoA hydratase/isomerase family protein [bacterium]|nr:enoyl-CoA hydratase/isomerase family protein [bacterium]
MNFETLLYEVDGRVATVTINRPDKLNALNSRVIEELGHVVKEIEDDKNVKAVVVTGAGEKAFVAGADISEMLNLDPGAGLKFARGGQAVFSAIENSPKPFIAAVNGFALGGGTELAMACDFVYASEKAKFGQPEINLGIIPGFGGTQRLPRLIGRARAKELMLTGDMIGADEAYRLGLVNKVLPPAEVLAAAKATAAKIAGKGAIAIASILDAVNRGVDASMDEGLSVERDQFATLFSTHDKQEGMAAFLEKRPAKFEDR